MISQEEYTFPLWLNGRDNTALVENSFEGRQAVCHVKMLIMKDNKKRRKSLKIVHSLR